MLHVYCVTYKNPGRRERMATRFAKLGLDHTFIESADAYDPSIVPPAHHIEQALPGRWNPKGYSALCGHMQAYRQMLADGHEQAIFCEDDILMRTDFQQHLPTVLFNMKKLEVDIMLLGYLTTEPPLTVNWSFEKKSEVFGYFNYPDGHWGVQQYIMNRGYATHLIRYFGLYYAHQSLIDENLIPYSTDWILSKMTNRRAMISPQLAVEECPPDPNENSDTIYHYNCHMANYQPGLHI